MTAATTAKSRKLHFHVHFKWHFCCISCSLDVEYGEYCAELSAADLSGNTGGTGGFGRPFVGLISPGNIIAGNF